MPTTYDPRRKRTTGAGVYSGYSKNFKPTGKSFGTSQESAALKALQFLVGDGGSERQIKGPDGRTYTVKMEEGGVSGVAGAIGSMVAKNVAAATTKNLAKSSARGMGKTARAVEADAAKAASRRTASESSTIRKGNQKAKTAEGSAAIDRGQAKANARTAAVDVGKANTVIPRFTKASADLPKGITAEKIADRAARPMGQNLDDLTPKSRRTAAQQAQARKDLEETMRLGVQFRAEGRRGFPGDDYMPDVVKKGAIPEIKTPRQADREAVSKALTKPRNPGKNASAAKQEKYQKDLAAWEKRQADMKAKTKDIDEGRRKPTGELKGASAKSARRQEEKRAKSKVAAEKPPAPKKPSTTKPKAGDPKPGAERKLDEIGEKELFYQEHSMSGYSKSAIDKMWKARQTAPAKRPKPKDGKPVPPPTSANRGERVLKPVDIVARPVQPKAGRATPPPPKPKGPFASGSPRAIEARAAGRPGSEVAVRPGSTVAKVAKPKSAAAGMAARLGKPVARVAAVGAAAGGAMALSKSDAGKGKPDAKTGTGTSGKAANAKAFEDSSRKQSANTRTREGIVDNKGRLISRKEFNQRSAFRSRFGLDKMTEAQREAWKKKNPDKWKAEVQRREEYRSTAGKKRFGKKALRITDKAKTRRSA